VSALEYAKRVRARTSGIVVRRGGFTAWAPAAIWSVRVISRILYVGHSEAIGFL